MTDEKRIRCGDTVKHHPTGEEWVVAYADYTTGHLAYSGWPEGIAKIAECELVESCTDEEHVAHVAEWLDFAHRRDDGTEDHRQAVVRRLYRP